MLQIQLVCTLKGLFQLLKQQLWINKCFFLKLLSEIIPGVQERGANFEQQPVTNECTCGGKEKLPASRKKTGNC